MSRSVVPQSTWCKQTHIFGGIYINPGPVGFYRQSPNRDSQLKTNQNKTHKHMSQYKWEPTKKKKSEIPKGPQILDYWT